jgi:hypothetical protein
MRQRPAARTFAFLLLACCTLSYPAGAGSDSATLISRIGGDIGTSLGDACALVESPAQWSNGSLLSGVLAAGAVGGAIALDNDDRHFALSHTSAQANRIILPWQDYGDVFVDCGAGAALYCSGLAFSNDWMSETGRSALTAVALGGCASLVLKVAAGRARPYLNEGPHHFSFLQFDDNSWSFPSDHTVLAFALSSVLAERIDNIYVAIPLYGIAAMTGIARVYGDQHWTSDVVAGALIGTAIGHFVGSRHRWKKRGHTPQVDIRPMTAGASAFGAAVCITY